ncbi:FAD-dependent monooxygenase [Chitinophaga sp. Cy-1792]|uniref:FAD-dependent monooxygenase n=1 Tax=Chitinophaga sp. Cy-1792 TaxID=2608339 RepID=UPI0014235BE7|nr:FAD-dependent monooxygenase [Chitinophaga sp. Cy-1792]NIG55634.1 FAD-dependent oxidoreductase [Chitinophaga sp. Cy-1792]
MQTASHQQQYDVIISGAGPVGLFLAGELALYGCAVLILEKTIPQDNPLKKIPFGIRGLSSLSIEALHRRGLLEELQLHKRMKQPHSVPKNGPAPQRQSGHFAGIPLLHSNIDTAQLKFRLPSSNEPALMSEMQELETVFSGRAAALGVTVLYDHPVTDFRQTTDSVTVWSGEESFHAKWLVGCDGSRSIVRKAAGFEFAGTEPEFTGYNAQVELTGAENLRPGRVITPQGLYFQSQPGYLMMQDFDGGAFHASKTPLTAARFQEVLRRISGCDITVTAMHNGTLWTDRARQATAYRKGRILLAGDAAHIHSPLGGQGLNLGLGDVMNLGWKLAATIHNTAPEGLLDTYFSERFPVGEQVLDWSRAQVAVMHPNPHARALYAVLRDLINTPDGATYMASRIWGVSTHYDLGGHHPMTGYNVPNFEFEDGTTIGEIMRDGRGILLDFSNNDQLKSIATEYAAQLKYVAATPKISLGVMALLVRPDGIVAWATDSQADTGELQAAANRWFVRS